ncbi:glycosyltransferase family 39 protein, partial [Sporolactobacillus shoreicorticis]
MRVKRILIYLFSIAFAGCFLSVLAVSLVYPLMLKQHSTLFPAMPTALSLALFAFIVVLFLIAFYRWLHRRSDRASRRISISIFAIMLLFEALLIFVFHGILPPIIDGGHTYAEALYLLAHGQASDTIYFKVYPNNIPITLLRYFLYSLGSWVHFSSYMLIDRFFCALMLNAGIFISWRLMKKRFDERTACLYLIIALTCLPLFFYIMYFYTDTVAIAFPALLLYLWAVYAGSAKIRYIVLLGLALGIGNLIRPNLILFLPALVIYMFFVLNWKKAMINTAVILVLIASTLFASHGVARHFGYTADPSLSMPSIHWVMLGLSRDGGYNARDFALTHTQPNQALKKQADRAQIVTRIKQKGMGGLLHLWGVKAARTWGTGARGYYWYTHLSTHPTKAYQYLFNHRNQMTVYIIQVFYIVEIFLLIFSALRFFRTKKADMNLLIQICLFGNFIFNTFVWEAEPRYSLLFTPLVLLGAVFGFRELAYWLGHIKLEKVQAKLTGKRVRMALAGATLAAVLLCAWAGFHAYAQAQSPQRHYLIDQRYSVGKKGMTVDAHHCITQTFDASRPFNRVSFHVRNVIGEGRYRVSVTDPHSGRRFFSKEFVPKHAPGRHTFKIGPAVPGSEKHMNITQIRGNPGAALNLAISGHGYEQRDAYPGGYLLQNGVRKGQKDLQFAVYQVEKGAYLSKGSYILLFTVPVLMVLFYMYTVLTMDQNKSDRLST